MNHKGIAVLAAAALCAGMLAVPASAAAADYPAWALTAAQRWEDCGKLGDLAPDTVLTLTQLRTLLSAVTPAEFTGEDTGTPVTRQDLAVYLQGVFALPAGNGVTFADAGEISPSALEAVAAVQSAGVMQGSGGYFHPSRPVTAAEAIQAMSNAVTVTGPITGLVVRARGEEGVLSEGQPAHVNDGKVEVVSVTETDDGYAVELRGTEALTGQEKDADAIGNPQADGKWMGLQLRFTGLVRADELQYSKDGETWTNAEINDVIVASARMEGLMVYLNGAEEPRTDAQEVEKDMDLYIRQGDEGGVMHIRFHYVPAG